MRLLKFFNIRNLNKSDWYIALWCIYFLQGILYSVGGVISQSILMLNLLISIYYVFYANTHYLLPKYYKRLNFLVLMFTVYGIIMMITHGSTIHSPSGQSIPTKNYLQTIYSSLLSLYPCYVFAKKGLLTKDRLRRWVFVFFAVATMSFFREQRERLSLLLLEGIDVSETTINSGYIFLTLIPLLVLFQKKLIIQYAGLMYCLYFVIMGMKRGAILIGIICLLYFLYTSLRNSCGKQKFLVIILICTLIFLGKNAIDRFMTSSSYFQSRIEQTQAGNTSGRDEYYSHLWDHFVNKSNVINMLIGNGAEGAFYAGGYIAHNDWLEILLGQGIFGVIIYIFYWSSFWKSWRTSKSGEEKAIIGMLLFICLTKTFFSMSYQSMSIYTNSILALCLSGMYRED